LESHGRDGRLAHDAGLAVTELHTSWLDIPPEEAVFQARAEPDQQAVRSEQINDAIGKVLASFAAAATNRLYV
jgi:hypothetical protein